MTEETLTQIFGRFVGERLKDPSRPTRDCDTTLDQINDLAAKHGLSLRTWFPGTMGTMELRGNRLNVHMDEQLTITEFRIG